jgi:hypothetical protein
MMAVAHCRMAVDRSVILAGADQFLLSARIGNVARADLLMSSELLAGFGAR